MSYGIGGNLGRPPCNSFRGALWRLARQFTRWIRARGLLLPGRTRIIFTTGTPRNLPSPRAGSANSDRGLSGGSVLWQPKMAEKRRTDEQTSTQEPFGGVQGQGGFGGDPGREDLGRAGRAV